MKKVFPVLLVHLSKYPCIFSGKSDKDGKYPKCGMNLVQKKTK